MTSKKLGISNSILNSIRRKLMNGTTISIKIMAPKIKLKQSSMISTF